MTDELFSPQQVAKKCDLSYHTILRAIKRNELQATRLRGRIKVPQWALEQWVDENMITPATTEPIRLPAPSPPQPPAQGSLERLLEIEAQAA